MYKDDAPVAYAQAQPVNSYPPPATATPVYAQSPVVYQQPAMVQPVYMQPMMYGAPVAPSNNVVVVGARTPQVGIVTILVCLILAAFVGPFALLIFLCPLD